MDQWEKDEPFQLTSNLQAAREKDALCDGDDFSERSPKIEEAITVIQFRICTLWDECGPFTTSNQRHSARRFSILQIEACFLPATWSGKTHSLPPPYCLKPSRSHFLPGFGRRHPLDWSLVFYKSLENPTVYTDQVTAVYRVHSAGAWSNIGYYNKSFERIASRDFFRRK